MSEKRDPSPLPDTEKSVKRIKLDDKSTFLQGEPLTEPAGELDSDSDSTKRRIRLLVFRNQKLVGLSRSKHRVISELNYQVENQKIEAENARKQADLFAMHWKELESSVVSMIGRLQTSAGDESKMMQVLKDTGIVEDGEDGGSFAAKLLEVDASLLEGRREQSLKLVVQFADLLERQMRNNTALLAALAKCQSEMKENEDVDYVEQLRIQISHLGSAEAELQALVKKQEILYNNIQEEYYLLQSKFKQLEIELSESKDTNIRLQRTVDRLREQKATVVTKPEQDAKVSSAAAPTQAPAENESRAPSESDKYWEEKYFEQKYISDTRLKNEKGLQDKLNKMYDELSAVQNEKVQLITQISITKNEKENAALKMKDAIDAAERIQNLMTKEIERRQEEIRSLNSSSSYEIKSLKDRLYKLQDDLDQARLTAKSSFLKLDEANANLDKANKRLESLEFLLETQSKELQKYRAAVSQEGLTEGSLVISKSKQQYFEQEVAALKKKIDEFHSIEKGLNSKLKDSQIIIDFLQQKGSVADNRELEELRILEKQLQSQKADLENEVHRLNRLLQDSSDKEKLDALEAEVNMHKESADFLAAEFEDVSLSNQKLIDMNRELLNQGKLVEAENTKLITSKARSDKMIEDLNEKSKLLQEKLRLKVVEQQAKTDAHKELKEKIDKEVQLRTLLNENSKLQAEALAKYKESALKDREKCVELEDVNKKFEKRMPEIEGENSKNFKELGALKRELQIANEDRALLQKRLTRLGSSSSSTYEEELMAYKKMLRCSVCDDRPKSAIITTCCHLFCRECINLNLKSRNRKCPGCKKMFGENDVHSVYF